MKRSQFSESQIVAILKEGETGTPVDEICRTHGISRSCYYKWKTKYGGMEEAELKRLKALEAENAQLKRMYADLSLKHEASELRACRVVGMSRFGYRYRSKKKHTDEDIQQRL